MIPFSGINLKRFTLDQLAPSNHLVRKMEASIDFSFIYDSMEDMFQR
ncbi:hypothetical protein Q8G35_08150 [Peribacillus simplex]|uniref:IS5/IS1182 family transposase n=2 Tax=Peribacillus TaxID=2675229 RepID=A0AA90T669_9BACI|nr:MULTISPECIES: hypothetical protein [Peribacillus]MDP1418383.1 hypothetical protein [Peribacillus simplex]MDP1451242.1 hypothetical protein [Peribacillus frigoritolerans]